MKALNKILNTFNKTIGKLEDLAEGNMAASERILDKIEELEDQNLGLLDEAEAAYRAAKNIRKLLGE